MYPRLVPRFFVRLTARVSGLSRPWTRDPPPSGMRPTFFTSTCTMWPGRPRRSAAAPCSSHRPGRYLRRLRPNLSRMRDIVRRLTPTPSRVSSDSMRGADHLCSRRIHSILATIDESVAVA